MEFGKIDFLQVDIYMLLCFKKKQYKSIPKKINLYFSQILIICVQHLVALRTKSCCLCSCIVT
jgi:hypothetical protein